MHRPGRRFAVACLTATLAGQMSGAIAETLPIGQAIELSIGPGDTREWALPQVDGALRIVLQERGVDVELVVIDAGANRPALETGASRWADHQLTLVGDSAAERVVQIRGNRPGAPPGTVLLHVQAIDSAEAQARSRLDADLRETELAATLADRARRRDPATVTAAQRLLDLRLAQNSEHDTRRAVLLLDRILAQQGRRADAVRLLTQYRPLWRTRGDARSEASMLNALGMHHYALGDHRLATPLLQEALDTLALTPTPLLEVVIRNNLCLAARRHAALNATIDCFERALSLSQAVGDLARIAGAHNNLGGAYSEAGDSTRAAAAFEQAIALNETLGTSAANANTWLNLSLELQGQARFSAARHALDRADEGFAATGDARGQALVLRARGYLQSQLGETASAVERMAEALQTLRDKGSRDEVVQTLTRLARDELLLGRKDDAFAHLDEAIALARIDGSPHLLAETLLRSARLRSRDDDGDRAATLAREAHTLAESVDNANLAARATLEIARAALGRDDAAKAEQLAGSVLDSSIRHLPLLLADAYAVSAAAKANLQRVDDADVDYAKGLELIEAARTEVADAESRASFLATHEQLIRGRITLLMQRASADSDAALAARAFALSGQYRARVLVERMQSTHTGTDPRIGREHDALLARLSTLAMQRWQLDEASAHAARRKALARQIADVEEALRSLAERRREGEVGRPVAPALQADLASVQRALPAATQLVEYLVDDKVSWAWVVSADRFAFHRLPARADVNAQVEAVHDSLGLPGRATSGLAWTRSLRDACRTLWQPLVADVTEERVIIVADGSLSRLPFAALRCVDEAGAVATLVQRHELSLLPAAALLARKTTPRTHGKALLVVDPVYSADDARLGARAGSAMPSTHAVPTLRSDTLARLPGGLVEAREIQRLLGPDETQLLHGSEASLRRLDPGRLGDYAILHFATHGLADVDGFAGAGLVLSLYDDRRQPVDGFLSMRQIAAWRLHARLVMLGACDGGNGRLIVGEGLSGLAWAFLSAGADTVVAPLWAIEDGFSSRLAIAFYRNLLDADRSIAASLRAAQLAMLAEDATLSPAVWASTIAISSR